MKYTLERSGGFTGIPMRVTLDSQTLDPQEREALDALVETSGFFALPEKITTPSPGADRFNYRLSIEGSGRSHTVDVAEGAIPASLRPLIQRLTELGRNPKT
jgi:hypothetical protein